MLNLMSMTVIWLTCSFNFYLISFTLTNFDQVYLTTIFSCLADIAGYASCAVIFLYLKVKKTQLLGFSIASLGGIIILIFGLKHES